MTIISILGAGRSCGPLIDYLAGHEDSNLWSLRVYDMNADMLSGKVGKHDNVKSYVMDLSDMGICDGIVAGSDIVVSMLPAFMHVPIAKLCITHTKHMVTASYASPEMKALDAQVKEKNLCFINEVGVDPGIDHMSSMAILEDLKQKGATILSYESFTGGILAPESPDNPWHYKFTWNPRNVVLAGAGGSVKFIQEGKYKHIPYNKLFRRTEFVDVPGYGRFEGYANRDSLKYIDIYGLQGIPTMYRGTFRRPGFCRAWDTFVKIGATDDSYQMEEVSIMTHRSFLNSFLAYHSTDSVELKLMHYLLVPQDSPIIEQLTWIGMFSDELVGLEGGTPAQILEHILKKVWTMTDEDVDLLIMLHRIGYSIDGVRSRVESSMVVKGKSSNDTAMAFTVGYPVAIATELLAKGKVSQRGVILPLKKELYEPILAGLATQGLRFDERVIHVED